jgi:hypothetical protein
MSAYYFDSSALVKNYAQEVGTNWVRGLINAQPANEVFTALVTGAEIIAAIKRRERSNTITAADAASAITAFRSQFRIRFMALRTSDACRRDGLPATGFDASDAADQPVKRFVVLQPFVGAEINPRQPREERRQQPTFRHRRARQQHGDDARA